MFPAFLNIPVIFGVSLEVYFILLFIAIPVFLFWRWLFRKYIRIDNSRKISTWVATFITTPIIYVGLICLWLFWPNYTPSKDFDRSEWLTYREGRFQMAKDIIRSKLLIGKDTAQVKQILGEPTWGGDTTNVWIYDMGWGGGGLDVLFHHLNLTLDKNAKVISAEHIEIRD